MKVYAILLLAVLSFVSPSASADERFLPYIDWLVANSDLSYNGEPLPTVQVKPYAWVEVMVYGPETVAQAEHSGAELPEILGAYVHTENIMLFPEGTDWWTREDVIVHELVHFLQYLQPETVPECHQKLEKPAYKLHWQWVEEHGLTDVYKEPNWLFVFMLEMACQEYHYHSDSPPFAR